MKGKINQICFYKKSKFVHMDIKCPVDTITHKGSSVRINSKVEKKVGQLFNFVLFTLP